MDGVPLSLSLEGVIPQSKRLGRGMEGEMHINGMVMVHPIWYMIRHDYTQVRGICLFAVLVTVGICIAVYICHMHWHQCIMHMTTLCHMQWQI